MFLLKFVNLMLLLVDKIYERKSDFRMKKFLKGILSFALSTCLIASVNVYAENTDLDMGNINFKSIEPLNIGVEDVGTMVDELVKSGEVLELNDESSENIIDKNIDNNKAKQNSSPNEIPIDNMLNENKTRAVSENTDPNNAYVINFGRVIGGNITAEGQQRWYGIQLDEKAKISSALAVADSSDFDLYLFKLDTDTMSLHVVAGAASGGAGVTEYFDYIADSGIYYFMVNSYSGTGEYSLVAYKATNNIKNEPNDTLSTATEVDEKGFTITDAIDNPFDIDYYKVNYPQSKFVNVSFTKPENSDYVLYVVKGDKLYNISTDSVTTFDPGEYYYYVGSPSGSFDENDTYTLSVTSTSYIPSARLRMHTPDYSMVFQSTDRTTYYVNGNTIDLTFSFENHISNAYGSTTDTSMYLRRKEGQNVAIFDYEVGMMRGEGGFPDADLPVFVKYDTNWFGAYSTNKALLLSIYNTDYTMERKGSNEVPKQELPHIKVVVDVNTGKVFDIFHPNVYYMIGNQEHRAVYPHKCIYDYDTKWLPDDMK